MAKRRRVGGSAAPMPWDGTTELNDGSSGLATRESFEGKKTAIEEVCGSGDEREESRVVACASEVSLVMLSEMGTPRNVVCTGAGAKQELLGQLREGASGSAEEMETKTRAAATAINSLCTRAPFECSRTQRGRRAESGVLRNCDYGKDWREAAEKDGGIKPPLQKRAISEASPYNRQNNREGTMNCALTKA